MEAAISCHPAIAQEPGQPAGRGSRTPGPGSRCVNQPSRPLDADLAVNLCFPISALLTPSSDTILQSRRNPIP